MKDIKKKLAQHSKNKRISKKILKNDLIKDKFTVYLSNFYLFIQVEDNSRSLPQQYFKILVFIYFFQLFGICTSIPPLNQIFSDTFQFAIQFSQFFRVSAALAYWENDYQMIIWMVLLLIQDIYFIYCSFVLGIKSTKDSTNNFKKQSIKIKYVLIQLDMLKWVMLIIKMDFVFGWFNCYNEWTNTNSQNTISHRCLMLPRLPKDLNQIGFLVISAVLLLTSVMIIFVSIFIYNSADLVNKNNLKTPFSYTKIIEYIGIIILVAISYSESQLFMIIATLIFVFLLVVNLIRYFPYPSREISLFYLNAISILIINLSMYIFYTFSPRTNQQNYFFTSIILCTLSIVFNETIWNFIIQSINRYNIVFSKKKDLSKQLLFFTTVLELIKKSQKNEDAYIKLQGLMNQHQIECKDINCPCISKLYEQKYKSDTQRQLELQLEKQALTSIAIQEDQRLIKSKARGIYLYELSQNKENYIQWILEFIDYQFTLCIKFQKQSHELEEFCLKFWYFQCKVKNNQIKCLYLVKHHTQMFQEKSIFFKIVEIAMTQFIENRIKEKDKSLRYSYRLKDTQEAIMYERFENFVLCEEKKVMIKQEVIDLIQKKIQYNEKLVEGYNTISELYKDIMNLMAGINRIERILLHELRQSKENIHFMRMLSLIKFRLINDPIFTEKLETQLNELYRRDEFQDKNIVHSLTVLKGNVVTIIASFGGKEKGLILNYSERTPQFFGYKSNEFYQINSVKMLMPYCVSKEHDYFIQRLIEQGTHNILRSYRPTLAKKKDGFLFPIKIYVNYYFGIQNELCFSSLVLKVQTNSHYVLIDKQGYIQGVSENFYKPILSELYEYECENLDIIKSNIRLFCPTVYQLIENYTSKQDLSNIRCEFFFPKRFQDILKNFQQECHIFQSQIEKSEYGNKNQRDSNEKFKQFLNDFLKKNKNLYENTLSYELSLNLEQEHIRLIDGRSLILYVVEITTFTMNDKDLTSTLGTTQVTKTTVFQKIYNGLNENTTHLASKSKEPFIESSQNILINQSPQNHLNIMASQFTVKNEGNHKNDSQEIQDTFEDLKQDTEQEIDIFQSNRQLPQHQIISSRTNIMGQDGKLKVASNLACVESSTTQYYNNINLLKVYESLDKQRDEILKQLQKEEKEREKLETNENDESNEKIESKDSQSQKSPIQICRDRKKSFKRQNSEKLIAEILTKGPDEFQEYKISNVDLFEDQVQKDTRAQMLVTDLDKLDVSTSIQQALSSGVYAKNQHEGQQVFPVQQVNPSLKQSIRPMMLQTSARKYSLQVNPLISFTLQKQNTLQSPHSAYVVAEKNDKVLVSDNQLQTHAIEATQENDRSQQNINESQMLFKSNQGVNLNYLEQVQEAEIQVNNEEFTDDTKNIHEYISEDDKNMNGGDQNQSQKSRSKAKANQMQIQERNQQASINSSEVRSTINTQIKQIHQNACSNQSPLFLKILFSIFVIQWFLFIIMVTIQTLIIFQYFDTIQQNLDRILLFPQAIIPLSKSILSLNFQVFANENRINMTGLYNIAQEQNYFHSVVEDSFSLFQQNSIEAFQRNILFNYQKDILNLESKMILTQNDIKNNYFLTITDMLNLASQIIYTFSLQNNYNTINSQNSDFDQLQDNFSTICSSFSQINSEIYNSLFSTFSSFQSFNGINFGVSLVIIVSSYIFVLPSFQQVNKRLQDILKLICRITEKEAFDDIHMLTIFQEQLESSYEEYLVCSVVVNLLETNLSKQKSLATNNNQKKQRKIGQYLCDRIKEQTISQTSFCLLLLLLFLICSVFFIAEFILLKIFIENTQPPSQTFYDFYVSTTSLSTSAAAHNLLFKHQIYSKLLGSPYLSQEVYQNTTNLFNDQFTTAQNFFSSEFLKFKDNLSQMPQSFQNQITFLQTNTPCSNNTYNILSTLEQQICLNALSGNVNKGLSASLQTVFAYMYQMKVDNTFDYGYGIQFINTTAYKENIQVAILNINILQNLIIQFQNNIQSMINNFTRLIIIVFVVGSVIYSIFFFNILIKFLENLFQNYKLVRKGIMLIPFKRVCEDNNTLSLIKKYI
ncbi:transmembrane protein, putative, partial (macronuclear) [Tetrahymena thermophila SB210]